MTCKTCTQYFDVCQGAISFSDVLVFALEYFSLGPVTSVRLWKGSRGPQSDLKCKTKLHYVPNYQKWLPKKKQTKYNKRVMFL